MSTLLLSATSTEPAAGPGSVTTIMQSPSGGDIVPDLDPEKEAEGEEDPGDVLAQLTEQQAPPHDAGDGQEEEYGLGTLEEESIDRGEEEEWGDREEGVVDEEEEVKSEEEPEEESESEQEEESEAEQEKEWDGVEGEAAEESPQYVADTEETFPEEEEEELIEEEVEEYEYTKEEIKYMKTAFAAYQIEKPQKKQGYTPKKKEPKGIKVTEIPIKTLSSVLHSLGLNPTQEALKRYANWLDADPAKGVVKFEELLIIVGREKEAAIVESDVLEAFRSIDVEKTQLIAIDTLHDLLVLTGERFSPEEWIVFANLADRKHTGFVDYENFVARMGPNPPPAEKKKKGKKGQKGKKGKKRKTALSTVQALDTLLVT